MTDPGAVAGLSHWEIDSHLRGRLGTCTAMAPPALPGTDPCYRYVRFPDGLHVSKDQIFGNLSSMTREKTHMCSSWPYAGSRDMQ